MKEIDRAICLELEKALSENEDKSFVELLYDLGIIAPDLDMNESSESTYERVKASIKIPIPKTAEECLNSIKDMCKAATRVYNNEEFYEDDCDRFMGECIMAERILGVLSQYEAFRDLVNHEK